MNEVSTEQKIQLVQQIRTQYQRNQYDLNNRERILYGKTSDITRTITNENTSESISVTSESLKFRCALAALLFVFVIILDMAGMHPFGVDTEKIFASIAADYQENVTEFVETISVEHK